MCRAPPVNFAVEEEEEEEEEGGGAIISCLGDHISIFKKWNHYIFFFFRFNSRFEEGYFGFFT